MIEPRDLLDRPLAVGDLVVVGMTAGRSPAVLVGAIVKFRFTCEMPRGRSECQQQQADQYTVSISPLKSTTYLPDKVWDGVSHVPRTEPHKTTSIRRVDNIVKLEKPGRIDFPLDHWITRVLDGDV